METYRAFRAFFFETARLLGADSGQAGSNVLVEAFYREEIGVGHALLLAKLQLAQQEQALVACFKEDWSAGGQKPKRILLPVRTANKYGRGKLSNIPNPPRMDVLPLPSGSHA